MKLTYPSFATGFALNAEQSAYPHLWNGLVGLWSPEMGKQGDKLFDFSGYKHNASLTGFAFSGATSNYVMGKYGYFLDFDGTNDLADAGNIPQIDAASTQTMTVLFYMRSSTSQSNNTILTYDNNDVLQPSVDLYLMLKTNFTIGGFVDNNEYSSGYASSNLTDGKVHRVVVVSRQTSIELWIDGELKFNQTGLTRSGKTFGATHSLQWSPGENVDRYIGAIGETRVYKRDLTADEIRQDYMGASPLTLAPQAATSFRPMAFFDDSEGILVTDSLIADERTENFDETLAILDSIIVTETNFTGSESLTVTDSLNVDERTENFDESLLITDSVIAEIIINQAAPFATKVISVNPLIFVTDGNPAKLTKVDISVTGNPTWETFNLIGVSNASDVVYNPTDGFLYISCDDGKIKKVDFNDPTIQTTIDVSDTDDLTSIEVLDTDGIIYAGTENNVGELYLIDQRTTFAMDSDFNCLHQVEVLLDSEFWAIQAIQMDSDIQILAYQRHLMNSNFQCLPAEIDIASPVNPFDQIIPLKLKDFHVYINNVELAQNDVILESIRIVHSQDQKSIATFTLTRKHDQLNTDRNGTSSIITSQNNVKIYIQTKLEFEGTVSDIDSSYSLSADELSITAIGSQKESSTNQVTVSLPGLDERLNLYHVMLQNPKISNPLIDEDDENPKKFKGIKVNLGTEIQQNWVYNLEFDSFGTNATKIQDGSFVPRQTWTYFWSPTLQKFGQPSKKDATIPNATSQNTDAQFVNKTPEQIFAAIRQSFTDSFNNVSNALKAIRVDGVNRFAKVFGNLGQTQAIYYPYIGTSLSPVSDDLWILTNAKHYLQKQYPDDNDELGEYTVGSAPFKEVSVRNGRLRPEPHLEDRDDGLYLVTDAGYNFIEFAKRVADLEYQKLLNINGDILPDTSCQLILTVDAYYHYGFKLLTKVNVDNTTTSGIFNNNNGFPVSIKTITISAGDLKITLDADNTKSTQELADIDGQFPDEDDDEFNDEEKVKLKAAKADLKTYTVKIPGL